MYIKTFNTTFSLLEKKSRCYICTFIYIYMERSLSIYIYKIINYSNFFKREENSDTFYNITWMNLEDFMLNGIGQLHKDQDCMVPYTR